MRTGTEGQNAGQGNGHQRNKRPGVNQTPVGRSVCRNVCRKATATNNAVKGGNACLKSVRKPSGEGLAIEMPACKPSTAVGGVMQNARNLKLKPLLVCVGQLEVWAETKQVIVGCSMPAYVLLSVIQ